MTEPHPIQTTQRPSEKIVPRGFVYPLEAIATRKRWTLDRLEREWNERRRALEAARAELQRIEDTLEHESVQNMSIGDGLVEVGRQRRLLGYLMQLQQQRVSALKALVERKDGEAQARRRWTEMQREIDAFGQDRARLIDNYRAGLARAEAHEADRAWTLRGAGVPVSVDTASTEGRA